MINQDNISSTKPPNSIITTPDENELEELTEKSFSNKTITMFKHL